MTDYVLVHGGWHGGWVWEPLADRLRAQGHRVFAPSLTGLAERAHLIDAVDGPDTHVDDIARLIAFENLNNLVLVGHSYGGMIVGGVATRLESRIKHLVYLDAFVPTQAGQAASDMAPAAHAAEIENSVDENGNIAPTGFHRWVADPSLQDWLKTKCTGHPRTCFGQGVSTLTDPSDLDLRRHYYLCLQHDPSPFHQFYELYKDDPFWSVRRMDCLHNAMIEMPDELADDLLDLK